MKEKQKESCTNCKYGVTIPPFPYECSLKVNGEYVHFDGYCPENLICEHWKEHPISGMEDTSEMWRNARIVDVD